MGLARHDFTPSELVEQIAADREGAAHLILRDGRGIQRIVALTGPTATVGREPGLELVLAWDTEVSRVHARLERVGGVWTVVDDGLSRNGTFLNNGRLYGRVRLTTGDLLRFGRTEARFRDPASIPTDTVPSDDPALTVRLTDAQRQVLVALCRPVIEGDAITPPATNPEIAAALQLSVEAVRTHLKSLFARLEVPELAQNRKRAELVRRALTSGIVSRRDLV